MINTQGEPDRKYYIKVWGFDPQADRVRVGKGYRYEAGYPLAADPGLYATGVSIWARVDWQPGETNDVSLPSRRPHNRIVFKREDREASVMCTHTVVNVVPAGEVIGASSQALATQVQSTEFLRALHLPPEEHFVALRSYVAAIAETGIGNLFREVYSLRRNFSALPIGFNDHMQRQVIYCLEHLAGSAADALLRDVTLELLERIPLTWLANRFKLLNAHLRLRKVLDGEPLAWEIIERKLRDTIATGAISRSVADFLAKTMSLPADIQDAFVSNADWWVRKSILAQERLPVRIARVLAQDPDWRVRSGILRMHNLPADVLRALAHDEDFRVRVRMAKRLRSYSVPWDITNALFNDPDSRVSRELIRRQKPPETHTGQAMQDLFGG